ncbi:Methyltransferase OMS1, mitochondrial [Ceratocystis fimbriata CBS 114723]|uniref:Methyltransferase OMS1, mitochondrial n=1 Tax=Ceratocystis fimbriata CBS 114723 TaxID=1035309 RepID=A0A2C5WLD1_9PEZI|nr:Methyltransferase OMS1, mitochondrial [Ceratocystis fimbriata CBS 114723]
MSAHDFDKSLDGTEAWSGIMKLRAKMASLATGNVLEVAVGTGRNVGYYDWGALFPKTPADVLRRKAKKNCQLTSYTAVDISSNMLEVANEKLHEAVLLHDQPIPSIKVIHGDLDTEVAGCLEYANGAIRPLTANKYDTVLQTFGLCSVSSPQSLLANLASVTQPNSGKIILLEHGKASYRLVNTLLDRSAPQHFEKYGCWWNRDIEKIVTEAAAQIPGLEVVRIEKPWFQLGTLYWIELRVNSQVK